MTTPTRYSQRPRAPSPPGPSPIRSTHSHKDNFAFLRQQESRHDEDSDMHAYSTVDGPPPPIRRASGAGGGPPAPPAVPPKNRIDRMFGDSVCQSPEESSNEAAAATAGSSSHQQQLQKLLNRSLTGSTNRNGSLSSNASSSTVSSKRGGSLANLYQARKNSSSSNNIIADAATVHQIKNQFQAQIESMLQSQVRNQHQHQQPLRSGHIQSTSERELNMIRGLQRDKSFDEARTAVQKQIERIFSSTQNAADAAVAAAANKPTSTSMTNLLHPGSSSIGQAQAEGRDRMQVSSHLLQNPHNGAQLGGGMAKTGIKHGMHGVSHALPGELDDDIRPPPIHYGVNQAIANRQSQLLRTKNFLSNDDLLSADPSPQPSLAQPPVRRSHDSLIDSPMRPSLDHVSSRLEPPASFSNNSPIPSEPLSRRSTNDLGNIDMTATKRAPPSAMSTPKTPSSGIRRQTTFAPSPTISSKSGNTSESSAQQARQKQPPFRKEFVRHKVDYLGSLPISSKSTNLASLQRPLKDLYFKYRAMRNLGQTNLPGTLEINDTGLTVQYIRELHKGVQEIFNPFPTIAVWAAVKFIHKRELVNKVQGVVQHRFAFLPLISDPEANDKMRLFHNLENEHEVELAADAPHPPVFACVMRRMTGRGPRSSGRQQLECHGFVCATSEDAILIAANLYQALLETMKKQKSGPERPESKRSMANSPSVASARGTDSDASHMPVRPPRRKRRGGRSAGSGSEYSGPASVPASVLQRRKSVRSSIRSNRSARSNRSGITKGRAPVGPSPGPPSTRPGTSLSRNDSRRSSRRSTAAAAARAKVASSRGFAPQPPKQTGDVYTRVAMPRSKSFMNVNNQYNLQELFKELKEKEGVESIDDVLKKIISPNGISFNEIKPVYRELLLKLAMTMSQDEIFQRSKNILHQQQKENNKDKKKEGNFKKGKAATMTMEKSATKKKAKAAAKKAASGKDAYMSQSTLGNSKNSEQSTLGSFFKFSRKSKENLSQQQPTGKAKMNDGNVTSNPAFSGNKKGFSKADISGPIPIANMGPRPQNLKTPLIQRASKITSTPLPPAPVQKNPSREMEIQAKSKSSSGSPTEESSVDDAYGSCSECAGYDSVSQCTYDSCSCRGSVAKSKDVKVRPKQYKEIEKHFREHGGSSPPSRIPEEQHHHSGHDEDCDCETDSCIYSEKCYCSLRGDPRGSSVVPAKSSRGTIIPPPPPPAPPSPPSSSCCCDSASIPDSHKNGNDRIPLNDMCQSVASTEITTDDSGTDTTCYSVRHIPVTVHKTHDGTPVSGVSSPLARPRTSMDKGRGNNTRSLNAMHSPTTAWKRNQMQQMCDDSDCNYSDALPAKHSSRGAGGTVRSVTSLTSTTMSTSSSNCKLCMANHVAHRHDDSSHVDDSRKGSGGSGYHSNTDSYSAPTNHYNQHSHHDSSSCCSCGSSCAGMSTSSRKSRSREGPRLSLARSQSRLDHIDSGHQPPLRLTRPRDSSLGDGLSSQEINPTSTMGSKVLVVSAVDRAGKVMYKGSTSHKHKPKPSANPSSLRASQRTTASTPSVGEENNVLHMKKSAEIAAVFSGAKINQTTDIVDPFSSAAVDQQQQLRQQQQQPYSHTGSSRNHGSHRENFSEADMHSSLGYFP